MPDKAERVTINIIGAEVGVQYEPVTSEATLADEHAATELALHALCQQCVRLRELRGVAVPPALMALVQAETFRELM